MTYKIGDVKKYQNKYCILRVHKNPSSWLVEFNDSTAKLIHEDKFDN
jgi:hypothetical protein